MILGELIRRKEELLRRLLPISVQQLKIVRQNNLTVLLQHLAVKQRLMNEFEAIEQQLRAFPPEKQQWENETERLESNKIIEHCALMLEEIIRNDSISMEELGVQKTDIEAQLRRVRQGSRVFSSYAKFR
jgi:agmatine/peptidylarginine deiminase